MTTSFPRLPCSLILALNGLVIVACTQEPDAPQGWVDTGTSDQLLDYDLVPQIGLKVDPDDVERLEANPREYVPATIVFQGQEYGPVGLRCKGQNSFLPFSQKPSLRINVNEYIEDQTFFGLKDLTLNNMSSDPSMMHERLAYRIAREAGLPASRANHAQVTVNGEPYGLYINVETVKRSMFADPKGTLFEATDVDFTPELVGNYEVEAGPDDRTLLTGLAQALALPNADEAITAANQYIDINHFLKFWAMESIIAQFDAMPYSFPGDDYYVYADPTTNKLQLIPWGMDETFLSAEFPPMQVSGKLATRCLESPGCRQNYINAVWDMLALTENFGLEAERARVQDQIAPLMADDNRKPYAQDQITEFQTQLGYFIRGRRTILTRDFPPAVR